MGALDEMAAWLDARRPSEEGVWTLGDAAVADLERMIACARTEREAALAQCRRETKRAFARYLRSVIGDYEVTSTRRVARRKAQAHTSTEDGLTGRSWCGGCGQSVHRSHRFCPHCGAELAWKGGAS